MRDIFESIYINKVWKESFATESGPGSTLDCSEPYLMFLKKYSDKNNIQSILDLGCGDFNLMKHFNFTNRTYLGIDIVPYLIEDNNIKYGNCTIKFEATSILNYSFDECFDLIIIKDVFQHLSTDNVKHILSNIKNVKHIIITNDYVDINTDISDGGYTPINLSTDPFNMLGEYIFEWQSCNFLKKTFKLKL
jgi:2-polyprenyl-3-methyl-5-hydroxy-6-metoxy-1,4-benzoquinol methylase